MMDFFYKGCVLLVFCSVSYVLADPAICYLCSGIECDDPFNITNAITMNCSGSSTLKSSLRNIDEWTDEDKLLRNFNTYRATSSEYVCVTFVYKNDFANQNMTVRKCIAKSIDNLNACDAITKSVSATIGKVQSCQTCDTDLCNSGRNVMQSFLSLLIVCSLKILII
ncbi:uncharacterized protein [Leptinotarsa decemlineata]|uniref:uncharacterized protein n=1 Tax=Leptinotarsa decemlineata TaxID=7539 RepID=UPI000C254D03|nr:uncharacterized protein LOC111515870 [Leptinotarsa decemlineata]